MTITDFPQRPKRGSIRYQLQLPVSLTLAHKELWAKSENISAAGILLSTTFLIPEGSFVDVAVGIVRSRPGTFLTGRGRVIRASLRGTGDYALAIKLERDFEFGKRPQFYQGKNRIVASGDPHFALAWHTET